MNIIFECRFGSHLYGTNSPSSDLDIKGIYLPSVEEMLTGTNKDFVILNTKPTNQLKNTKDDIDKTYYSIQYFLKLLSEGQTEVMDMIHCNKENTLVSTPTWEYIRNQRSKFYTKSMSSFISYVKTQAAKYGIKGSRLDAIKSVMDVLSKYPEKTKLKDVWLQGDFNSLFENEYINFYPNYNEDKTLNYGKTMLEICEKQMCLTASTDYLYQSLDKYYKSYGARAEQARMNQGIDHKAVSHAIRASYQLLEIYETGDLKFPLAKADFLRDIKLGKYHFVNDNISELLENLYEEVQKKVKETKYPEKIEENLVCNMILQIYNINKLLGIEC